MRSDECGFVEPAYVSVPDLRSALGPVSLTAALLVVDAVTELMEVIRGWMDAKWLSRLMNMMNMTNWMRWGENFAAELVKRSSLLLAAAYSMLI